MAKCLKSIDLQGLKTFATLTRLEFPGRITAIVGPNGSGKSNIADSIRWVLGEQSYSLLRAKRTEDMIFSGSQQRSRAGMASATITFNNEDGWLPIDFSEVSVSRRAYRDGQNEYLLNGQKVRLMDVVELLSQTGLSERTYTIIGQGLVDVALAIKPDERRKLFEEAAGIGLYRSRKEESLRRLENTRKNLDRVLDIMTEIRPRLRSLERQAGRFVEYERLRSDLKILLQEWYGYHWHQKQQDLRNARNAYHDQEKRLNTLHQKYSEAEVSVEKARGELNATRKVLENAHSELSAHHRKLEQVTRELAIIDERQRSNVHQKSNLEIDIANVQEEINEYKSQEQSFKAEIDKRLADFESTAEDVKQVENDLSKITLKKKSIEAELESIRKIRIAHETKKVQVSARLEELENRIASLDTEKSKIQESIGELENKKSKTTDLVETLAGAYQKSDAAYQNHQKKLLDASDLLDEKYAQRQALDQQLANQETHLVKLQAQLDVLMQAEVALSGYSAGTKTVVENSRKGKLPKGIEPLSKHLIIDERFEKAISAALGELTDLLVIPANGKDAVIEYLETKENDRVALVTEDQVRPQRKSKRFSSNEEIFGYANDLIKVDPKFQALVDKLFSDTLIVRDKQTALKVQDSLAGSEKAVTIGGLVFQANGVMISGQNALGRRIGRTRRQSEMQEEMMRLTELVKKLEDKKQKINETIQKLQNENDYEEQALNELEDEKNSAFQMQQDARDSLTRLSEQLVWHDEQMVVIQENIQKTQAAMEIAETEKGDFNGQIDALQDEEKIILTQLNELPVFETQQELNHWQTHRIVTQNALEAARQRYQDHHQRLEEAQQRLATYQTRLSDLELGLGEIESKEGLLRDEVDVIHKAIEEIEKNQIVPLTSAVEQKEQNISALEKLETHSHQQVIIAERQFTQLQLELSRREDHLDNLREHIEDDFGLVSYEYDQKIDGPTPLPLGESLVHDLPIVQSVSDSIETDIKRLKGQIRRIGAINPEAQQEYLEVKERYEFLTNQIDDLEKASKDLSEVIEALDDLMARDFLKTFKSVDKEFSDYFSRLFNGGEAKLLFADEENPVEGGVDIEVRLPGRRSQGLALLSGGERSLTAVALIFALLKVSPTPFCILDEVDAMLDESNVGRFVDLLQELSKKTQFVIITHNRNTVQAADVIYGVTMGRDSTSQMISLKLEDVDETYLE